jgi:hypothetical protein
VRGRRAFSDFIDLADGFHGNTSVIYFSPKSISKKEEKYNLFSEIIEITDPHRNCFPFA